MRLNTKFPGSGPINQPKQVVEVTFAGGAVAQDNNFVIIDAEPTTQRAQEIAAAYPRALSKTVERRGNVVVVWMTARTPGRRKFINACA